MGAIAALFLTGLVIVGIYKLLMKPDSRAAFWNEFWKTPGESLFVIVWVGCCLFTFWAVFVPPLGALTVSIGRRKIALWMITGGASLAGLVITALWSNVRSRR